MRTQAILGASALVFGLALGAQAQGVVGGAAQGSRDGDRAAGPVGAVVGGAVGAVTGGVAGLIGGDQRPRFHRYVEEEHYPSYRYDNSVEVGATLPESGPTYYEVPREYGETQYRYTIVNGRTVLVDPRTRRIVEVIE